ncbi:MAG TPA: 1-(5-phosphoribosyl)-5-[(5-phosphoribosylamino)methylideneamino]imidazole-4-carboxamide isomerase [Pyrinomonadaceae bacterium]
MQIIPAIDLKDGRCVRLTQGLMDSATTYGDDPIAVARSFEAAGAGRIHVVDLDGAFSGVESSNRAVVKEIVASVGVPVQFGGGVRSVKDIEALVESGVALVILGTLATESIDQLKLLLDQFGNGICVGIDARDGVVMKHGWAAATNLSAIEFATEVAKLGIERVIYTDIKRDGMLTGPNIEQTIALARAAQVKVTASGGVSSLTDIEQLATLNEPLVDSVIVGRALYERRFTLEEALAVAT